MAKFSIDQIKVTYPVNSSPPPFNPVVCTIDSTNAISRGWYGNSDLPNGPLRIPNSADASTTNIPQPYVITHDAQYTISYIAANSTPPISNVVSMQNITTATPYPNNQTALWTGTDATVDFVLNIDVSVNPNKVTLAVSTDS